MDSHSHSQHQFPFLFVSNIDNLACRGSGLCLLKMNTDSLMLQNIHRLHQMHAKRSQHVLEVNCSKGFLRCIKLHGMGSHAVRHLLSFRIEQGSALFRSHFAKNLSKRFDCHRIHIFWLLSGNILTKKPTRKTFWAQCFLGCAIK